jgi:hypothetical protein
VDGNVTVAGGLDALALVVELVLALGAGRIGSLAVGVLAAVQIDIGVDFVGLVFLRSRKVRPGQRAGVQVDLAGIGDDTGRRQIGVAADIELVAPSE